MILEIKKLTADLLDDWLDFFDNIGFSDDGEWSGCYCICYHYSEDLARKKSWDCSNESDSAFNRRHAIDFIKKGKMKGYLAYSEDTGKVCGWVNANDISAYQNVYFTPKTEGGGSSRVKCVMCFLTDPNLRGRGIAASLLDRVCSDAKEEGYDFVYAYPFAENVYKGYHGSKAMYISRGFEKCGSISECLIYRLALR